MQQYRYIDIYRYDIPNAMPCVASIDILHDDIARIHIDGFLSFAVYKESLPTHLFINTTTSILSLFFFY